MSSFEIHKINGLHMRIKHFNTQLKIKKAGKYWSQIGSDNSWQNSMLSLSKFQMNEFCIFLGYGIKQNLT